MNAGNKGSDSAYSWLLLFHQLPAKPAYARVKIWRRLSEIGAVALKNAVHVLPANAETREDFEWLLREIVACGGEGVICDARLLDGLSDDEAHALFDAARDADYQELTREIHDDTESVQGEDRADMAPRVRRWRKRLAAIVAIDFFGALGRQEVERLLTALEARMSATKEGASTSERTLGRLRNRVWVTRKGVKVDRIACAWLIRRFIDPAARFKFVVGQGYQPEPNEVRFDMFEAEFTHDGERCSFEVLLGQIEPVDPTLQAIAEIVHDIDLKDSKFERAETAGISSLIEGIAAAHADDDERLARGGALFDDLYANFRRGRS